VLMLAKGYIQTLGDDKRRLEQEVRENQAIISHLGAELIQSKGGDMS